MNLKIILFNIKMVSDKQQIFETLYSLDKKNKIREWDIQVKNEGDYSDIIIVHGGTDARKIETINRVSEGKNIGKKNETTHYQQACKEATSKWIKKRDIEGYKTKDFTCKITGIMIETKTQTLDGIMDNAVSTGITILTKNFNGCNFSITIKASKSIIDTWIVKYNINVKSIEYVKNASLDVLETIFKPMLANDYHKQKSKLFFPCYIQPKLDGMRLIYNSRDKSVLSRQGKSFDILKQSDLMKELETLKDLVFDGELYVHGGVFEHLGILRKKKITDEESVKLNQIEYHIYDIIDETMEYTERLVKLTNVIKNFAKIKLIKTFEVTSEQGVKNYHLEFINQGYEGSMLRNKSGKYKCKYRSNDLLKYKDFMDAEFPIVDYTIEIDTSGGGDPLIVWICKNENGDTFNVRPKGCQEERKNIYKECETDFNKYKGRKLWVKFFEYTDKMIPRFPTTKTNSIESYIRDTIL